MRRIGLQISAAALLMGAAVPIQAQLMFNITGDEFGTFPVQPSDALDTALVVYNPANGAISFKAGVSATGTYQDPLFCFDFGDPDSAVVGLQVRDLNGHSIIDGLGLTSALQYDLGNDFITIAPPPDSQCFYRDFETGTFGRFGVAPSNSSEDTEGTTSIFGDDFVVFPNLDVDFLNVASAAVGDTVQYDIRIANTGDGPASELAFQEVFPVNANVYSAVLTEGSWQCIDDGQGIDDGQEFCPAGQGTGPLRFQTLPSLPAGGVVTFRVTRSIPTDPVQAGHDIHLHAAVVNGEGSQAKFDVAEAVLNVEGDPAALTFAQQPSHTTAGDVISPPVVVNVVDANGNIVTTDSATEIQLRLKESNGNAVSPDPFVSFRTVTEGELEWTDISMEGVSPGTGYFLQAIPSNSEFTISQVDSAPFDVQ